MRGRGDRLRRAGGVLVAGALALTASPAPADARGPLRTVVQDDALLLHRSAQEVAAALDQLVALGVDTVRVTAGWSSLTRDADAQAPPAGFDETDPAAYEQARWAPVDRLVRLADERDLDVMLDIGFWAPHWATDDAPGPRARTHLDVSAFGRFATAVARRYSGTYVVPPAYEPMPEPSEDATFLDDVFGTAPPEEAPSPAAGEPLPRVSIFGVWNEPNHPAFLLPQLEDGEPASPATYRRMVAVADAAVKAVQPEATVLIGGLASKDAGGKGVAPLEFVRELACVDARLRPRLDGDCADFREVPGDGFTMHPYSLHTPPDARPSKNQPDDVPLGALPRLTRLLDRLADRDRLAEGLREVWITEYGYETDPPAQDARFGLGHQVRFLPWAEYLAWRDPRVVAHSQFLLRDVPPGETRLTASTRRGFGEWHSGLQFADGTPKPAQDAFAAGVFVRPLRGRKVPRSGIFGRVRPGSGRRTAELQVRRGDGSWRRLRSAPTPGAERRARFRTAPDGTFDRVVPVRAVDRKARVRVRYRLAEDGPWVVGPGVAQIHRPSPLK